VLGMPKGAIGLAAEAQLFAAARAELVRQVIGPALEQGRWVVSDRFLDSSLAYQGAARGLGIEAVLRVNEIGVAGTLPDRSVVLDLPPDVAARRTGADLDRIEAEGADFQALVGAGYRLLAERFPERVSTVSALGAPAEVSARVVAALEQAGVL